MMHHSKYSDQCVNVVVVFLLYIAAMSSSVAQYRSIANESLIIAKQQSKDMQCYINCVIVSVAGEFGVKSIQGLHFCSAQGSNVLQSCKYGKL